MYNIILKRLKNIFLELSDGAGMLRWMATHEHEKIVAKQLQTMFHSDR
jgi:predicted RNA methylase